MTAPQQAFDIAIIGSGIAGSTLGTILARHGLKVIIFEAKSHPKFAIGESMILETSETMRAVAELFDVPELAYFSSENYLSHIGTSHGVKRHFSFLHHLVGQPHQPNRTLQAVIPKEPHGHELHLYRQDSDYFLMATAIAYGATVLQNTAVGEIEVEGDGVTISTQNSQVFQAKYVVDAGASAPCWQTNSRCETSICKRTRGPSSPIWSMCPIFTKWPAVKSCMTSPIASSKEPFTTSLKGAGCGLFPSTTIPNRLTRCAAWG